MHGRGARWARGARHGGRPTSLRRLGLPEGLQLGLHDPEHGASALRRSVPARYRYHYLSGGANTGRGWTTWADGGGSFVTGYVQDSLRTGSCPCSRCISSRRACRAGTPSRSPTGCASTSTIRRRCGRGSPTCGFFTRAASFANSPIVLHVEPDLWGYAQRDAPGDDLGRVPAHVAETGDPELAGLPDSVAGLAQAVVRLRDALAPNVVLGYQLSMWGTGHDIAYSDPPDNEVDALAQRASAAYASLHAAFDLVFVEYTDRDAGFRAIREGITAAWWDDEDFRRNIRFLTGRFQPDPALADDVAGAGRQHPDARDEQHAGPLPGQQGPVAARRAARRARRPTCEPASSAFLLATRCPRPRAPATTGRWNHEPGADQREQRSLAERRRRRRLRTRPHRGLLRGRRPRRARRRCAAAVRTGSRSRRRGCVGCTARRAACPAQNPSAAVKRAVARVRITVARRARAGSRLRIGLRLRVPATVRRRVDLEVRARSGKLVFQRAWRRRRLRVGSTHSFATTWRLRRDLRPGRYTVKVVLLDPGRPRLRSPVHGGATVSVTRSPYGGIPLGRRS